MECTLSISMDATEQWGVMGIWIHYRTAIQGSSIGQRSELMEQVTAQSTATEQ